MRRATKKNQRRTSVRVQRAVNFAVELRVSVFLALAFAFAGFAFAVGLVDTIAIAGTVSFRAINCRRSVYTFCAGGRMHGGRVGAHWRRRRADGLWRPRRRGDAHASAASGRKFTRLDWRRRYRAISAIGQGLGRRRRRRVRCDISRHRHRRCSGRRRRRDERPPEFGDGAVPSGQRHGWRDSDIVSVSRSARRVSVVGWKVPRSVLRHNQLCWRRRHLAGLDRRKLWRRRWYRLLLRAINLRRCRRMGGGRRAGIQRVQYRRRRRRRRRWPVRRRRRGRPFHSRVRRRRWRIVCGRNVRQHDRRREWWPAVDDGRQWQRRCPMHRRRAASGRERVFLIDARQCRRWRVWLDRAPNVRRDAECDDAVADTCWRRWRRCGCLGRQRRQRRKCERDTDSSYRRRGLAYLCRRRWRRHSERCRRWRRRRRECGMGRWNRPRRRRGRRRRRRN